MNKDGPSSTIMPVAPNNISQNQVKIEQLIHLVKGRSARSLKAFLDSEAEDIDLMQVNDDRGYSLLHLAAFKKISNDFESIIIDYAGRSSDQEKLINYIN